MRASSGYGNVLAKQDRFADAEEFMLSSCEGLLTNNEAIPILVKKSTQSLIDMYQRWEKPEKVKLYQAKLNNFNQSLSAK